MRRLPIACLLLASALGVIGPSAVAAGRSQGNVLLQPSDASGNDVPGPGYYDIGASPGSRTRLYALVGNTSRRKAVVRVLPVDAQSGVYGGVSYGLPHQRRQYVGTWITLSRTAIQLLPGRAVVVPFTVHVPQKAKPGQYVGGITAFIPTPVPRPTGRTGHRRAAFILQIRRVVAVVVTVPGSQYARFTVTGVRVQQRPDAVYLITAIRNSGNVLLKGQADLWVWKTGQRKAIVSARLTLDTTVPQTTVQYPIRWTKRPKLGKYHFQTMLWWSGGKTLRSGDFWVK